MRVGIRGRLIAISVGVIVASVLVTYAYLRGELERLLAHNLREDLRVRVSLVAARASQTDSALDDFAHWDALADELARRAEARVTLIRRDGVVLGDSELSATELGKLESHANRPELERALNTGFGVSQRYSATLSQSMQYAAVPVERAGKTFGTARVAVPMTQVDEALSSLRAVLFWATGLALVLSLALATAAAHVFSRRTIALALTARRMADGDLEARSETSAQDEIGELGQSLDRMALALSTTIERVRSERDRLRGILSGMQEGVLLLDHDGRIAFVNSALREVLLLPSDVVGEFPEDAIKQPELRRLLAEVRDTGEPVRQEIELGGLQPRTVLVHAALLAGDPGGVFCVLVDFTEMRRLESIRRDFVANVSHELRTPVTAIRSATETLQVALASDPASAGLFMDIIDRNATRLQELVEDLLDLSRIESREVELRPEAVDLRALLEELRDLFRERAAKKQIQLEVQASPELPVAHVDSSALEHVLSNLIDNAVKYCGPGTLVRVSAVVDGDSIRIAVGDSGPGIEERHLPRLFERFYRVDPGRSREIGGTGLGLSIVKHLVEAFGGKIVVDSRVGEGTTFSFSVPQAPA